MKKLLKALINVFYVCIVAIFAVMLISLITGTKSYIVKSGSMEPKIKTGSIAFVNEDYDYNKVEVGDIIAYNASDDVLVTHRVINKQDGLLETKGDNNDITDGFAVSQENFAGLTVVTIPYLGYLFAWVQTKKGLILTLTIVSATVLLEYMLSDNDESDEVKSE
jgi:signal peptidase